MTAHGRLRERRPRSAGPSRAAAPCLPRPLGLAEFAGRAESVGEARGWARGLLAEEVADDVLDDAVVLLSELITNSVVHSDSGRKSDGLVTVFLAAGDGGAYCEVIDDGSATSVPSVRGASDDGDGGRGLWMVNAMADAWGFHHDDEVGNAVWFRIGGRPASHDSSSSWSRSGGAA
ncbi:ATP-binding protein [Microtetraspora malaysiensis]|uniref:ATP-binding protein n=1 Tax=Microtetraspora malaysiensis TaxID=161358 RepID=UPI003D8A811D